jgi:phenylalanyl-tRNA synthetase beta chain
MKIPLNWLKDYVDINVPVDELAHQMTMLGLEIEAVENTGEEIQKVYIGQIISIEPHPDADKLVVCKTDVGGKEPLQIVCGAKNMKEGDKVPTAIIGATLPSGFQIGKRKMRGVASQGMMCAAQELGLTSDSEGLLILDEDAPIGADAKDILGLNETIIEIEVIPNRGDWASMIGVARELAARYETPLRIPEVHLEESGKAAEDRASITIDNVDLCPRYAGRILRNVKVGPAPEWLQKRLIDAGQRPINNIVDITNFVLLETGHPLHAFDYDKLAENRVVVRTARAGETITTLDGEERKLSPEMLVIADAERPQAVAGVMGGADSEVGEGTTTILLESAIFDPISIRRTSRALNLITEASQHFQRGADHEMCIQAVNRAAALMHELANAEIAPGILDAYPAPRPAASVAMRYARCEQLLGAEITPEQQRSYLKRLGLEASEEDANTCQVTVPPWRQDIRIEAHLVEEVGRLHGFENIVSALPRVRPTEQLIAPKEKKVRELRQFLAGQGMAEFYNWTFSCPDDVKKTGLPEAFLDMVFLANPLSEKQAAMRRSLAPGLLDNTRYNAHRGVRSIAAFELGPIYEPADGKELPDQRLHLGLVFMGLRDRKHWSQAEEHTDFYDLKGAVEGVCTFLGADPAFKATQLGVLQGGQAAEISVGEKSLGWMGKVRASVLRDWEIEHDVYLAELDLDVLLSAKFDVPQFQSIPEFPPALRDLAVLVNADVPAGDLLETVRKTGGKSLKKVDVFDIYRGKPVPDGKKSVALSLTFQSQEQTLTDKQTQKHINKILNKLQRNFQAELR